MQTGDADAKNPGTKPNPDHISASCGQQFAACGVSFDRLNCTMRLILTILAIGLLSLPARGDDFVNPKANIPPKAKPDRRNAGEGVPPLPLPATPLRRSEKKREPSPPALVGSVTFSPAALKGSGGKG